MTAMKSNDNAGERAEGPAPALADAVEQCRQNPAFLDAIRDVYRRADEDVAKLQPGCQACGECCKFDLADHRLYLSTGELAILSDEPPPSVEPCRALRCPYQADTLCLARNRRATGCRIFFCNSILSDQISDFYEAYHTEIRHLHETHCLPYIYAEVTSSILQLFYPE